MFAPVRRQRGEIVILRRLVERPEQGLMQPLQTAHVVFLCVLNRLLRQIVAQDQARVHRLHRPLPFRIADLFLLQTLTILLIPGVERRTVDKLVAQRDCACCCSVSLNKRNVRV